MDRKRIGGWIAMIFAAGSFWAAPASGEKAAPGTFHEDGPVTVRLFSENDAPFYQIGRRSDRYYTNGAAIAVAWSPTWADDLAERLPFAGWFGEPDRTAFGVTAGQLIFTPEDLESRQLIPEDRPYAGYLYAGAYLQRMRNDVMDHFQLDVGVIGDSSFAQDMQEWVHDILADIDPNGWDNQLSDELTVQFTYRRKWRLAVGRFDLFEMPIEVEAIPDVVGRLGLVHRDLGGGGTLRFGRRLPDDFGPARLSDVNAAPGDYPLGLSAYGFIRVGGRVVEHNVFLEGSNFDDSHGVPIHALVGEAQVGVAASYTWSGSQLQLGWSQTFRTKEFEGQEGIHAFGAWTVSFHCWY